MILTRKRLLVDIFLTRRLLKSLAFCEFASVNFEPWARSILDSTVSCDVTERYSPFSRPLFPRLRADNGSRENA